MQIDVWSCIKERADYRYDNREDVLVGIALEDSVSTRLALVVPESFLLIHGRQAITFRERFECEGLFDLGVPYVDTSSRFVLMVVRPKGKRPLPQMMISNWSGDTHTLKLHLAGKQSGYSLAREYRESYSQYIASIEEWIDGGRKPADTLSGEFTVINVPNYDKRHPYPKYYSKKATQLRAALAKEHTTPLSEIATLLFPKRSSQEAEGYLFSLTGNPANAKSLRKDRISDVVVQRGDIVISTVRYLQPRIVQDLIDEPVYATMHQVVIRGSKVLPEYLCLYLNSETASLIAEINSAGIVGRLLKRDIEQFPVILPRISEDEYRRLYCAQSLKAKDISAFHEAANSFERNAASLASSQTPNGSNSTIEDILASELVKKLEVYKEEAMREFLDEDLQELNTCYRNGAYKAAIILAGSILEALLIDWLSEIDGKDYFEEDYILDNGQRATLSDYINMIKEIEYPKWMDGAKKAHEIRGKRNLIHAKLCLKEGVIDEKTCRQVVSYLRDVIKTRISL